MSTRAIDALRRAIANNEITIRTLDGAAHYALEDSEASATVAAVTEARDAARKFHAALRGLEAKWKARLEYSPPHSLTLRKRPT